MLSTDLHDWIRLHLALGQSEQCCHKLLDQFKTPTVIFQQSDNALKQCGLSLAQRHRLRQTYPQNVNKTMAWENNPQHHIIHYHHPHYPQRLKHIHAPPILLYIWGNPSLLGSAQIGMVGSRNPSHYGKEVAYAFAAALAQQQLTITSGMALGIDACSHRGVLQVQGHTIAVLGSGLNQLYPRAHESLAKEISLSGAVLSELPLDTPPRAPHFPKRNRIISGLSMGVVVVEASIRSGSLITARLALEQNREVFAVPGSIHNPLSKGCLHLIQQGAKAVEKIEDILSELFLSKMPARFILESTSKNRYCEHSDSIMNKLLDCVNDEDTSDEIIIKRSGFDAQTASSMLLNLELHGYIESSPNGYRRIK
jgi:DNA processing protein